MNKKYNILIGVFVGLVMLAMIISFGNKQNTSVSSNSVNQITEIDINNTNSESVSDNSAISYEADDFVESKKITIDESTGEIKEETITLESSETPIIGVTGGNSASDDQDTADEDEASIDNSSPTNSVEDLDVDNTSDAEVYINEDGEIVLPLVPLD